MARRTALCIGINEYGGDGSMNLAGCVNDAQAWAAVADQRGFSVTLMLDRQASRDALLGMLEGMVGQLKFGDRLLVTNSSHGTFFPSDSEADGTGEAWVASDRQLISDDDLYGVFSQRAFGSRVLLISDSCHSGTMNRGLMTRERSALDGGSCLPVTRFMPPAELGLVSAGREHRARLMPDVPVPLMAACAPSEVSWETMINGRRQGQFTAHALMVLEKKAPASLRQWVDWTRQRMPVGQQGQSPQLDASWSQARWVPLS